MESARTFRQRSDGSDATYAGDRETVRRLRPFQRRTEHCGRHSLCHSADVGVPWGPATCCRGLLRGRPWYRQGAIELSQPGCCGLRTSCPHAIRTSQVPGHEAVKEVNPMKFRWLIPLAILVPLRLSATDAPVGARVATITVNPKEITVLHLRPDFESTIRMPEEVTSVILGSPGEFKAEHNEGEPEYVYVKPITKQAAQSNLLIATKSGQHVTLELVSDSTGIPNQSQPVDFLIEYRSARSFLISAESGAPAMPAAAGMVPAHESSGRDTGPELSPLSNLDEEFRQQQKVNAPKWTKWEDKQIETSICDMRQWSNETVIAYSVLNTSDQPVEIVPPQIQITGRTASKKKKKEGKGIISDQLEIRDYRLSATRLEPGGRADGVVVFDRPNFKESTEKLFLQIAQADQVDRPILIRLPFTPPISGDSK